MKIPMMRKVNLALLTGLFMFSGMAWCANGEESHAPEPNVIGIEAGNDKAAKTPADGGGAITGIIRDATDDDTDGKTNGADDAGQDSASGHDNASDTGAEGGDNALEPVPVAAVTAKGTDDAAPIAGAIGGEPAAKSTQPAAGNKEKSTQTDDFDVQKVNINTATAEELVEVLKGIGPKKAQAIIDYREAKGPFASIEQLQEVKGIGPATLARNKECISLE